MHAAAGLINMRTEGQLVSMALQLTWRSACLSRRRVSHSRSHSRSLCHSSRNSGHSRSSRLHSCQRRTLHLCRWVLHTWYPEAA